MITKISKNLLIPLMVVLSFLIISSVYAVPFTYKYEAVKDSIYNNESAFYNFTLKNNNEYSDRFQIYTISAFWDISPTLLQISALSEENLLLEITPMDSKIYGPQLVPITVKSLSDEYSKIENFYVYIKPSNYTPREYVPNVAMEARLQEVIDPRNPLSLEIYMRNRNPLNLKELTIIVESPLFNKKYLTSLGPLEEKTNQILFADLNPLQEPGTYNIEVSLIYNNNTISKALKQIVVKKYNDVSVEKSVTKKLFSTTEKIILYNDGNSEIIKEIKIEKNFLQRIFTSSSKEYRVLKEDGKSYLAWDVNLKQRETAAITVTTNYMPLVIIIIVIIIAIIAYYLLRSPVILYKSAKIVSSTEHGVKEIKVKLHIKNRSGKSIRNIKVIDKYPKLLALEEDVVLGSLKPTKLLSTDKKNNLISWDIEVLDPYEERLLVYKLKSELNIVGNISLPSSKIKFRTNRTERSYLSNKVLLLHKSHKQIDTE